MTIRLQKSRWAIIVTTAILVTTPAAPGLAVESVNDANGTEAAIESLKSNPEVGPLGEAVTMKEQSDGSLSLEVNSGEVNVTAGDSPTIELLAADSAPLLVDALPGFASIADEGTAVFASDEGFSMAPLPHADGSVQIVTVLTSDAPEAFDYQLSSTTAVIIELQKDGSAVVLDEDGGWVGGVGSPWAFDANGVPVPTHFEVVGSTLKQIVEHVDGGFSYPITADPYLGQKIFVWHSVDNYQGDKRVNLRPAAWTYAVGSPILIAYGWPEALSRGTEISQVLRSKTTMRQQFDCHANGSWFAGDWNLERFRVTRTVNWTFGVAIHRCNWTTRDRY